jgi:hypothetical protein
MIENGAAAATRYHSVLGGSRHGVGVVCGGWTGRRAGRTHEDSRGAARPRGTRESSSLISPSATTNLKTNYQEFAT